MLPSVFQYLIFTKFRSIKSNSFRILVLQHVLLNAKRYHTYFSYVTNFMTIRLSLSFTQRWLHFFIVKSHHFVGTKISPPTFHDIPMSSPSTTEESDVLSAGESMTLVDLPWCRIGAVGSWEVGAGCVWSDWEWTCYQGMEVEEECFEFSL